MRKMSEQDMETLIDTYYELKKKVQNKNFVKEIRESKDFEYLAEIILHRMAFKDVEREVSNSEFYRTHDLDKIAVTVAMGKDTARKLHKKFALHHSDILDIKDNEQALEEKIIDYECCRYTKLDAPNTSFEYVEMQKKEKQDILMPVVIKLGLYGNRKNLALTADEYDEMVKFITDKMIDSEVTNACMYMEEIKDECEKEMDNCLKV